MTVAAGLVAAFGTQRLGREWFDAVALDESEVDEMEFQVNADRMEAAIRAKMGFPQRG